MVAEYRPAQTDSDGSLVPVNPAKCRANVVYRGGDNGQCHKNPVVFDGESRGWCADHRPTAEADRRYTLSRRQLQALLQQAIARGAERSAADIVETLLAQLDSQHTAATRTPAP